MIRFFSINDPYRLLVVFAFMTIMGIVAHYHLPEATLAETKGMVVGEMMEDDLFLYEEIWDSTPPLTSVVHWLSVELLDRDLGIRRAISLVILFFQAALFGFLLTNNRAFDQPGFLSSFIYAVLVFFSFDSVTYTREIWASLFLMLSIDRVLRQIQFRNQDDSNLTLLGIFLGMSSLFVFSYSIFYLAILIILILNSRPDLRQFLLFTLAFLFPHLLLFGYYYINGNPLYLWLNFYIPNFEFNSRSFMDGYSLLLLAALPLTYAIFSLIVALRNARMTKYQSQIFQIMVFWLLFGVLEVWIARQRTAQSLIVCAAPLAYLINFYLIRIRRQRIANAMIWILLIGIVSIASLSISNKISGINYSLNFPDKKEIPFNNKKLLLLSDNLAYFYQNQAGGFFPEWSLSSEIFKDPSYYEHVELLHKAFRRNPPEIIVDPDGLMPGVFYFLPEQSNYYHKNGDYYIRQIK